VRAVSSSAAAVALLPPARLLLNQVVLCGATLAVDDGSALMPCIWWQDSFERKYGAGRNFEMGSGANPFELGDYISVCGQIKWYQNELQLRVETAWAERDPNAEALWHAEVVHLTSEWIRNAEAPAQLSADQASNTPGGLPAASLSRAGGAGAANNSEASAYANRNAVCGHPATQNALDFENSPIVDAMRTYVQNWGEFSFSDLRADPELRQAAEATLAAMPAKASLVAPNADGAPDAKEGGAASGSATEMRVAHLFSRCIGLLASEGVVYLKDAAADIYCRISMQVIASALGDVMNGAASRRSEYEDEGVPLDEITDGLIHHPALASACLTRGQARRHLAAAVDASIVYESNFKRYKQSI
jgi:hypothetical protein